jgi:hypothetical protein
MFRRLACALAPAAALAAAVTAAAATAAPAAAVPHASWSGPSRPVPGAFTNNSPALSGITFPGRIGQGIITAWRGRGLTGHIFYKFRTPQFRHGGWSARGTAPGITSSAPAIGSYVDPLGRDAVLAVWTGHADHHIWYAQGETRPDGTINWTRPKVLPPSVAWTNTVTGPAVFFPDNTNAAVIAWRGPADHVRYVIGRPRVRGFLWSASKAIPGSPPPGSTHCTFAPCTSATPAIAEAQTGTHAGRLYVFWKELGSHAVFYATTPDPLTVRTGLRWTAPAQVPGAATSAGPAAAVLGVNNFGPLLLTYKAAFTTHVRFQTLTVGLWSASAVIPTARTNAAPRLLHRLMATTTPTTIGNIVFRIFR